MKAPITLKVLTALLVLSAGFGLSATPSYAQEEQEIPDKSAEEKPLLPTHLSVELPSAYSPLPGLSKRIAESSATRNYFGTEPITVGAAAYGRAQRGAFYLTWVRSDRVIVDAEKTIRAALDELHRTPFEVNDVGTVEEKQYREGMQGGLVEMTWEWLQSENGIPTIVRVLAWKDKESHLHLEIGECVLAAGEENEYRETCQQALNSVSLSDTVEIANLGPLDPPVVAPSGLPDDLSVPALETGDLRVPSSLGVPSVGRGDAIYEGKPKPQKEKSSSRIYIGIGIALLGLAIYLTTRSDPNEKKSWSKDDPKADPEAKEITEGDSEQVAKAEEDSESDKENEDRDA